MTETHERGPADLGEATMPDKEQRDPATRHGETSEHDEGIGDKVKDAVGGVIGKAKGLFGGDDKK